MTPEGYRARLHQARTDAGMSQRELAKRIGCSNGTISQVETEHRELTASKLFAWADACQVSLDWVAYGTDALVLS